jgi:hypothetical protein
MKAPELQWKTLVLMVALVSVSAVAAAQSRAETADLPPGFQRLLERGAIPSIDEPVFVAAEEADLPPEAWVLGVVIDGDARAYSLNLLNHHEIVNDEFGERPVAAVW